MQGFVKLKVKLAMAQNTKDSTTLFGNGIRKEFTRAISLEATGVVPVLLRSDSPDKFANIV